MVQDKWIGYTIRADGGDCPKREGGAHLPPSPYQKELVKHSASQGEIQISRMTVRLYCERGEVKILGLSKMNGERKVRRVIRVIIHNEMTKSRDH